MDNARTQKLYVNAEGREVKLRVLLPHAVNGIEHSSAICSRYQQVHPN
jgi:hypothetical protein